MEGDGTRSDRADLLRDCMVFQAMDAAGRLDFAERGTSVSLRSGQPLFHLGDTGKTMMVVVVGTVRVFLPTPQGKDITLADLRRGAVLGEVALFDDEPRSASAVALSNCELLQFDRSAVIPMLTDRPAVAMALIKMLCGRLRRSDERMLEIGTRPLAERLARTLIEQFAVSGQTRRKLSLTQSELADMVGSTRESVNRALRAWQLQGIVELRDGWIRVKQRETLVALAERQ